MHHFLTDIQTDFEMNRPTKYQITAKRNYLHRRIVGVHCQYLCFHIFHLLKLIYPDASYQKKKLIDSVIFCNVPFTLHVLIMLHITTNTPKLKHN